MQNKIYKLFEYAYIVMAAFSLYLVTTHWVDNRGRAYMFIFFAILAVFMFFFKRKFRKMTAQRNKDLNKK